ncbi:hypothetical protein [Tunicatimonas pelagia]|uniref:hypothetical protein n=1 Tax=Tunicatimonas pelagia TaxID=931531 RepID=UPI002666B838|nr:hypothetical protein [Tunicatimonas pelagia]WKN46242.1 hypothetical protein P0M28_14920 [Tunicatimonas pelagia]
MENQDRLQADIARLLELIRGTNLMLSQLKEAGNDERSLVCRQEIRLREKYATELDKILNRYQLTVQPLEI